MPPETAIIIRTKNEEKWLGVVLQKLFQQTYKDFEIIVVDSGSSDRTLEIAKKFPVKIFEIPPKGFSYPYALNYGIARSHATKFIVILSAHSVPVSTTWLECGIAHLRKNQKILGVYGYVIPLPDATVWDTFFQGGPYVLRKALFGERPTMIAHPGMGVLGFTNAIIRKELWDKRHFNEQYGAGGEDGEWAAYWLARGYIIIRDPKFTVMHSHYLGLAGWIAQWRNWKSTAGPRKFHPLAYRKNKTHSW